MKKIKKMAQVVEQENLYDYLNGLETYKLADMCRKGREVKHSRVTVTKSEDGEFYKVRCLEEVRALAGISPSGYHRQVCHLAWWILVDLMFGIQFANKVATDKILSRVVLNSLYAADVT